MDDDLVALVRGVAERADDHPGLANLQPGSREYERLRLNQVRHIPELDVVGRALLTAAGLDPDERYRIRVSPSSSRGALGPGASIVGHPLVARARLFGAETAVAEMLDLIRRNEAEQQEVIAVWGCHPVSPVDLGDGVQLVAMSQLPPSRYRDQALQLPPYDVELSPIVAVIAKPRAAIVRTFVHGPIVAKFGEPEPRGDEADWTRRLRDTTLPLTAALRRPVFPVAHWYQSEDTIALIGGDSGAGGQGVLRSFMFDQEPEPIEVERCATMAREFFDAEASLRRGLTIALNRLRLAHTRSWYDERAIDLGVALEAALFSDEESYQGEITYRLRLRGTHVRGGDAERRQTTWRLLGHVYKLRSRVAHGGPTPHDNETEETVINDGIELAFDLCERLLALGQRPDFDAAARGGDD